MDVRDRARFLEAQGTKPRYPLYGKPDLPVWIPSREYKKRGCGQGFGKCEIRLRSSWKIFKGYPWSGRRDFGVKG